MTKTYEKPRGHGQPLYLREAWWHAICQCASHGGALHISAFKGTLNAVWRAGVRAPPAAAHWDLLQHSCWATLSEAAPCQCRSTTGVGWGPEPGLFGAAWCISHGSSAWGLSLAWQRLSQLCCHLRLFFLFLSPFTSVRPVSVCRLPLPTSASPSPCILCGLSKNKPGDWPILPWHLHHGRP